MPDRDVKFSTHLLCINTAAEFFGYFSTLSKIKRLQNLISIVKNHVVLKLIKLDLYEILHCPLATKHVAVINELCNQI